MILKLFLPVVLALVIYPIGTIVPVKLIGYNYEVSTTSVAIINGRDGGTSIIAGVKATNYHDDVLFIGEFNFRAFDDSNQELKQVSCADGVDFQLGKNQSDTGTMCWTSGKTLTDVMITYDHSIFNQKVAIWSTKNE